jgi:glycerophosphoryl diester phosphodiesterase
MLLIGHRGYHARVPENTLEAFEEAVAIGVDGLETDIRVSRNGQALLYHDPVAPDGREVGGLTRDELSLATGYLVPTLSEALERFSDVRWFLEVKTPAAIEATAAVLRRYYRSRRCVVISRRRQIVERIREGVPVPGGFIFPNRSPDVLNPASRWTNNTAVRSIVWRHDLLDARLVEQAAFRGYLNLVYGPVTPEEHQLCLDMGVDGVITDYPEYVIALTVGTLLASLPTCVVASD